MGSQSGTTEQSTQQVLSRLSAEPFTGDSDRRQSRGRGLTRMLDWLQAQPGLTWRDRWIASAANAEGNLAWRRLPAQWLVGGGYPAGDSEHSRLALARGMSLLVSGDVIRPSLGWQLAPTTPRGLLTELARTRDPDGFATLTALCRSAGVNSHTTDLALRRIAGHRGRQGRPGRRHQHRRLPGTAADPRGSAGRRRGEQPLLLPAAARRRGVRRGRARGAGAQGPGPAGLRAADRPLRHHLRPGP